jgi:hypothetical protein
LIIELAFWNKTGHDWDVIYQRSGLNNGSDKFAMAVYPYEGNSTLLCHTLEEGLGAFGTQFRIHLASFRGKQSVRRGIIFDVRKSVGKRNNRG